MENPIWHPFTNMTTAPLPLKIVRGQGTLLFDESGKSYIDAISSWWVNLHGHAHPYIAERIHQQMLELEHVIFAGCTHEPAQRLAQELIEATSASYQKVFYSDNGSTAVETALKIAFQYWHNQNPNTPKTQAICFDLGYHGDTFGSMSASGENRFSSPFKKQLFTSVRIPLAIESLQDVLKRGEAALFIFEPLLLGASGMIAYAKELLEEMIALCKAHGVITIADEVMTGFGRLGSLFACDQLREKPDMICLSKGITGGFLPLGATLIRAFLFQGFSEKPFLHGHSYTGNPLCCTAALASLELLQTTECRHQRQMIAERHQAFVAKVRPLKRALAVGTILILEWHKLPAETTAHLLSKGILVRPLKNVLYLMPPYCITPDELTYLYEEIEKWISLTASS